LVKQKKKEKPWITQRKVMRVLIRAKKKTPYHLPDYDMKHVSLIHVCTTFSIS